MAELKNEFSWSFSRHHALDDCPRRYWFRYYGGWGGWNRDAAPDVRDIYRLTKLQDRATWKGHVVHEAIARALRRAQRRAPQVPVDDVVSACLERMREDYRDSKDDRARISGRYKDHARFFEHEEGQDDGSPEWKLRWKETASEVEAALRGFFASALFAQLQALPEADWIEIEDPGASVGPSFALDGVKVYVKLDCAFREKGLAVVIDWKTGKGTSPATPIQLAAYALYMQHVHGVAVAEVEAREVNVASGKVTVHDVGEDALEVFQDVFAGSVERMRSLLSDVKRNVPKPASAFPFTEDERNCRFCHFRGACPKITPAY